MRTSLLAASALILIGGRPLEAQVLVAPGESTETAFRREVSGRWFGWLAAQEEGDATLARSKTEELVKNAEKIGIRRLTDLSLSATLLGRRDLLSGKHDRARIAFETAVRLDPDLPEARWGRLFLSGRTKEFGRIPSDLAGAFRATLADREARRVVVIRTTLLFVFTGAALGAAFLLVLVLAHGRRYIHDLSEFAIRFAGGLAAAPLAIALFFLPLLLGLDLYWFGLVLFVAIFGYASPRQKIGAAIALALFLPLLPVIDRVAYELAVTGSPILRGAETLQESRYDQRVLDDLESVKNILSDDSDVRFLLGCLYQTLGQNDRAVREYSAAVQADPAEFRSLINRGNIHFVDGDFGAALEDYQAAVKRNAKSVAARYNLSLVLAETFRTVESVEALNIARALDGRLLQKFQQNPTLVKVVSLGFTPEEARVKVERLQSDPKSHRILGHYRTYHFGDALATPALWAIPLALVLAFVLDAQRQKGRGYASECQKCGRTFCSRCKPAGQSLLLCSQCVHVYLKKDGVAIETALQKVEEVKKRRWLKDKLRALLNVLLPGAATFIDSNVGHAAISLSIFLFGVLALATREAFRASSRPSAVSPLPGTVFWAIVAVAGWAVGVFSARRAPAPPA